MNDFMLNFDTFADGQVSSKLWLCETLEDICHKEKILKPKLYIYGSWYGILGFLLLARGRLNPSEIHFFDLDQSAIEISKKIHNHWLFTGTPKLFFHVQDCNETIPPSGSDVIVVNTSCEHFTSLNWWNLIPDQNIFVLQSTNMKHEQHVACPKNLEDWKQTIGNNQTYLFSDEKFTDYHHFSFTRFMLIGRKNKTRD